MHVDEDWPPLELLHARYLRRVLDLTGGNKTQAAEVLGIDRRTIGRMLARERKVLARARPLGAALAMIGQRPAEAEPPSPATPPLPATSPLPATPPAVDRTEVTDPAPRALVGLEEAIEQLLTACQQIRAVEVPGDIDRSAWRRVLRRLASGMVEVQASARELDGLLPSSARGRARST
ncbi:MAG: helix-turn-helix domain-containing protein [Minicystis sp.]